MWHFLKRFNYDAVDHLSLQFVENEERCLSRGFVRTTKRTIPLRANVAPSPKTDPTASSFLSTNTLLKQSQSIFYARADKMFRKLLAETHSSELTIFQKNFFN